MNQYHIYDKIGKGKYSTVYKGRRKKTISYYAVKSVDKSQKARVLQEVRTMHALDHKNVLRFFAWYETTNHLWLILEYCVGGDLMSLLKQDGRLPENSVHDFGRDLVVALQYLHHNSIIYCDLKPSNILLDENGRLKLGGFGMSRRLSDINKTPLQQLPPAKRGTPCYMAPELFSESATHSSASDLWALGCVLYEAAMGKPPFVNSSFNQLVQQILHTEPEPVRGASQDFAELLMRLLDKNPATRISWKDLVTHPFWQAKLPWMDMPREPQLEAFIATHNLAPGMADARCSSVAAKSMRQSVDVMRLSRIALNNLEKEGEGADYTAVEMRPGDIRIESTDAELDFDEQKDEGAAEEDEPPSPAQSDDSGLLDQGTGVMADHGGQVSTLGTMAHGEPLKPLRPRGVEGGAGATAGKPAGHQGIDTTPADVAQYGTNDEEDTAGSVSLTQQQAETLIWHTSDVSVKPIVANRRIERLPEPKYDAKSIPFQAMNLQDMLAAEQKVLESFLTDIYRAIASAAPLKDKVNVLSYFETLCVDTNAANVLINSSLTILFIRMLRNAKAPSLRVRLASVLGLLVRHATYIADELSQTGVIEILTEALRDKNEKVRRRVMATLGELLFYVATQQDAQEGLTAAQVSERWSITPATITGVVRLLKPQEDEVAQHYAAKTVENICSQGGDWAAKFCTQEVAFSLVQLLNSTKNENVKATVASTLSRVLRHSAPLVAYVVDKCGVRLFVTCLSDPNSKVQTAALNMLNIVLVQSDLKVRVKTALSEERSLVPLLLGLLDHTQPLLRAKAVVSLLLLCRLSTRWLLEACKAKLIPTVERLHKDKDEYLQGAIGAMRVEMGRLVPVVCQQLGEELGRTAGRKLPAASPGRPSTSKTPLQLLQVVLHLITSPYFRGVVITPALLAELAAYLLAAANPALSSPGMVEFNATLQNVVEAVCQQTELMLQHHQAVLEHLLPSLYEVVASSSETGDMRFFCLRMISEASQLLLFDSELYGNPAASEPAQRVGLATAAIDQLVAKHMLPLVPTLLREEDPMPLYALKLLGGVLEVNNAFVAAVERMGLATQFFDFLSLEHSNNNVHNIKLCRQIIEAGSMSMQQLASLQVAQKVAAVLDYASQNCVEPFLEPVLDLCHTIVVRDMQDTEAGKSQGQLMAVLLEQSGVFLELCAQQDPAVSCAAALCLLDMVSVYPTQCAPWLYAPDSLSVASSVLQGEHLQGVAASTPAQLQTHLLEALCRSARVPGSVQGATQEVQQMRAVVQQLAGAAADPTVRKGASELLQALSAVL